MNPKLDHHIGKPVTAYEAVGAQDSKWQITLGENNPVVLRDHDAGSPLPDPSQIVGMLLLAAEDDGHGNITVKFGRGGVPATVLQTVVLPNHKYSISVVGDSTDEPDPTLADALPADPSADRVKSGPDHVDGEG